MDARIGASFRFCVEGDGGGEWEVDLGGAGAVDATITLGATDLLDVANRRRCFEWLSRVRRVRVQGDTSVSRRLVHLWTGA